MSNRILDYLKGITEDTTDLANDSTPMPKSTRILDYVKDISEDTSIIVENGGGGGGGLPGDTVIATEDDIDNLFK